MERKRITQVNDATETNIHDESQSGRPFFVNDGFIEKANENSR